MSTDRHIGRTDGGGDDHDAEAWRDVGAHFTASRVRDVRFDLEEVLYDIAEKIASGEELTAADIDTLRESMDGLQVLTEEYLARLATDCEPWDRGVGMMVPYGVMRRHLEEDDFPPRPHYRTGGSMTDAADEDATPDDSGGGEN